MKKFLALLLVMMLIMTCFTACGSKDEVEGETPDTNLEQDVETGDDEANADADTEADAEQENDEEADTDEDADAEEEPVADVEQEEDQTSEAPADKQEEGKKPASDKKEEDKKPASDKKEEDKKPASDKKEEDKKPASDKKEEDKKPASDKKEENKKPASDKKEENKAPADNSGSTGTSVSGTPAEIIDKIYANHGTIEMPLGTMEIDMADPDALKMFTGLSSADKITAAAASESMMGAQAYSLVVVKLKDAADASAVASEMMNGIDQRKWICVEADDLRVSAAGDTVVLIMVGSAHADAVTAASITDAFSAVAGGLDLNQSK